METLQERRRLNEEIERAYINTSSAVQDILLYRQTERGIADIDLYETFFRWFSYLVILTSDVQQMRAAESMVVVDTALKWVMEIVDLDNPKNILPRCEEGMDQFFRYKKVLAEQGVIALPPR